MIIEYACRWAPAQRQRQATVRLGGLGHGRVAGGNVTCRPAAVDAVSRATVVVVSIPVVVPFAHTTHCLGAELPFRCPVRSKSLLNRSNSLGLREIASS